MSFFLDAQPCLRCFRQAHLNPQATQTLLTTRATITNEMGDSEHTTESAENARLTAINPQALQVPQNRTESGRFVPGQSGNPGGRPKKLTRHLDKLLDEPYDKQDSYAQAVVKAALRRAIQKSDFATNLIWERAEGKVPQAITGADGGPVQFQVAVVYGSMETPDETQGVTDCDAQIIENKQEPG